MAFPLVKIVASAFGDILLFLSVSFPIAAWFLGIAARLFFLFACVVIREEDIGKNDSENRATTTTTAAATTYSARSSARKPFLKQFSWSFSNNEQIIKRDDCCVCFLSCTEREERATYEIHAPR